MRTPNNERLTPDIANPTQARTASEPENARPSRKAEPERRCILTGRHGARDIFVRLAISPDGAVLPDVHAKAPGRGAWIGVSRADLENAIGKGQLKGTLARAFKGGALAIPEDLPEQIEQALRKSLLDRLGLELRAGKLVMGADRIAEQARAGRISLLLHAADASEDGRKKLDQAWRVGRDAEGSGERGMVLPLDRMALSVALGRDNTVHLALADAASADRIGLAVARLQNFSGTQVPPDGRAASQDAMPLNDELNA